MKLFLLLQMQLICFTQSSESQYVDYYNQQLMNYYTPEEAYYNGHSKHRYRDDYYDESEECRCRCDKCAIPKPCCVQMCMTCNLPNIVVLTYPYPVVMDSVHDPQTTQSTTKTTEPTTTTTTTAATTTSSTTTSTAISTRSTAYVNYEDDGSDKRKFVLTSLRRMKPDWIPKYGIVPIPNQLAEKLMSRLRNMKGIND